MGPEIPIPTPTTDFLVVVTGDLVKLGHLRTYPQHSPPHNSPPLVLTPSGGHRSTYGWQAGGAHPTGNAFLLQMFPLPQKKYFRYILQKIYNIGHADGYKSLDEMINNDTSKTPDVAIQPKDDTAVIIFSSGTTGLPKGVVITHYELIAGVIIFR